MKLSKRALSHNEKISMCSLMNSFGPNVKSSCPIDHLIDSLEMPLSKRSRKVSCESLLSITHRSSSVQDLSSSFEVDSAYNSSSDSMSARKIMSNAEPGVISPVIQESNEFHVITPLGGSCHDEEKKIDMKKIR